MKTFILSMLDRTLLEDKLYAKYKEIGGLKVIGVDVFQSENVNGDLITTVIFYYGFLKTRNIEFRYYNEELFMVAGDYIEMKFIDEMKNLLKELNK